MAWTSSTSSSRWPRTPRSSASATTCVFTARVPLLDAVLGGETEAPSLGGKSIAVRVPPETQNGRVIRLRGKGMPKRGGGHGDMLVTVQAVLPVDLTPEQRETVREAARGRAHRAADRGVRKT